VKSTQRFDYRRFADSLVDRGLIDHETIEHVVTQCEATGGLMSELLVTEDLVSDWEVARVACELYHLPFLTVDNYPPSPEALEGLDPDYLRQYALVPLDRHGKLLTIIMPGLVPSAVLDALAFDGTRVLPLAGSVSSNRRWLQEHLPSAEGVGSLEQVGAALPQGDWASIFDAGDEAVQLDLTEGMSESLEEGLGVLDVDIGVGDLDLGGGEDTGQAIELESSIDAGLDSMLDSVMGPTGSQSDEAPAPKKQKADAADAIGGIELRLHGDDEE
jgi:hypothetical protein